MLSRIWAKWRQARGEAVAAPVAVPDVAPAPVAAPVDIRPPVEQPLPVLPTPDTSPLDLLRRVRALRPEVRQYLHPAGVADDLVRWCQQEGYVGWLTVDEVRAAWRARHEQIGLSTCTIEMVLAALTERPDVRKRRVRLAMAPEYAEVRKRLQLMGKRDDRAIIYWIPPSADDAVAMAEARAAEIAAGNPPPPVPVSKPGRRAAAASPRPPDTRSTRTLDVAQPAAMRAETPSPVIADLFAPARAA